MLADHSRSTAPPPSHQSALHPHPVKLGSTRAGVRMCVELNRGFLIVISLMSFEDRSVYSENLLTYADLSGGISFKGRNHLVTEAELTALDTAQKGGQKGTVGM